MYIFMYILIYIQVCTFNLKFFLEKLNKVQNQCVRFIVIIQNSSLRVGLATNKIIPRLLNLKLNNQIICCPANMFLQILVLGQQKTLFTLFEIWAFEMTYPFLFINFHLYRVQRIVSFAFTREPLSIILCSFSVNSHNLSIELFFRT